MSHVTIVGAGAVGARIARGLLASADTDVAVDDTAPGLAAGLARRLGARVRVAQDEDRPAVVVLAGPRPHAGLAATWLGRGAAVVSVSDDLTDVRRLVTLEPAARSQHRPLVVGAAMSPGLSGLLARQLAGRLDEVDEIHVAVHGTGGPACARQHHHCLASTGIGWHDRTWIERPGGSGRELCWFPEPLGAWDCYRAELADPLLLVRSIPQVQRVTARLSANRRDRFTSRLPMLSPPHREGGLGGLRVEVRGSAGGERTTLVAGIAERAAVVAAAVATTFTVAALDGELPAGVVTAGQDQLDNASFLHRMVAGGLALREFVGTDARTGW